MDEIINAASETAIAAPPEESSPEGGFLPEPHAEITAQETGEPAAVEAAPESIESEAVILEEVSRDPNRKWYVIHTYAGYENKVKANLLRRIESMGMRDKIFRVLVPEEEEIEFKDGKRRTVQKKIYPGYVLVEMVMSDDSWYVVRNTSGVTGFVGQGIKPIPLPEEEVKQILRLMKLEAPVKVKLDLDIGQPIRVTHGPFQDFTGVVEEVSPEREKVKVLISIFSRETPVELDFGQVEKL